MLTITYFTRMAGFCLTELVEAGYPDQIPIELQDKVTLKLWPEFMFHDPVANLNWRKLFDLFSEFQFSLISNDEIIGVANSLPYFWEKPFVELPEEGWDWVFQKGNG